MKVLVVTYVKLPMLLLTCVSVAAAACASTESASMGESAASTAAEESRVMLPWVIDCTVDAKDKVAVLKTPNDGIDEVTEVSVSERVRSDRDDPFDNIIRDGKATPEVLARIQYLMTIGGPTLDPELRKSFPQTYLYAQSRGVMTDAGEISISAGEPTKLGPVGRPSVFALSIAKATWADSRAVPNGHGQSLPGHEAAVAGTLTIEGENPINLECTVDAVEVEIASSK